MSTLYELTKEIHELLPQVKAKYNLEFDIESDKYYYLAGVKYPEEIKYVGLCNKYDSTTEFDITIFGRSGLLDKIRELPFIEVPQIRQILVGLQEVLGKMENYEQLKWKNENKQSEIKDGVVFLIALNHLPKTKAESLWQKWLKPDFKNNGLSLFDREPETVLQELVDILKDLLK
jgi:hypothetical protein